MRLLFYLVSMLLLHLFMASFAVGVTNITMDQSALLAFKAHVIDPRGVLTENWSISYPVCSWIGISCGTRHHRVAALNLSFMGLQGTIPPHLGNLSFLVSLDLGHNSLSGYLPNELGRLRRLKFMSFADNKLIGNFPSWIGALSRLQKLNLRINNFTGLLPNWIFNLSKLEELNLRLNYFYGDIPSKIGNLSKLVRVDLGHNNLQELAKPASKLFIKAVIRPYFTAFNQLIFETFNPCRKSPFNVCILAGEIPKEIGNLQILEFLAMEINYLSGLIPPRIFNISTVKTMSLGRNQISGHLPPTTGDRLPNVETFYIWGNQLIGTIPNSITNASKLISLELNGNSFSGPIPNTFGNLRHLRRLHLGYNYLTTDSQWSFLSSLTNCRSLTTLQFASNPLRGILPPLIGNLSTSLQKFYAYECELKGSIPPQIGNLSGLILLSLGYNDLKGIIPTSVGRLKQLQAIGLDGNNLQGSIPYDLCHLEALTILSLSNNMLSGQIPPCLPSLISLRDLYLSSNNFSSSIPSSFWSFEYLLQIDMSSNSLSGSLPSNIQNLKVLIALDLSRNQLSGIIPITIGSLNDLQNLSLAGNQFEGPIPESFGNLTSLELLDVSSNNLSGEIPKSLEALLYLKQLNVSHNRLVGEIPNNGPFKNFSAQSFIWNYALCGPPRLQVPPCKESNSKRSKKAALPLLKYVLPPIMSTLLIVLIIIFFIKRRNRSTKNLNKKDLLSPITWKRVSYLDIQRATDGFNECNLLGTGSFGSVYKGTLSDGTNAAIKVFNLQLERAARSFDSECEVLRNVRHRNLIKILSSCSNPDFKALILEFMPNGSLEKWLYSHNFFLDILERLNIMIDVGLALEYLHHGLSAPVIHCDLKPNNILLDENKVAHVSDFGISKLFGEGDDSVTQTITMATIGYMAPEYGSEGIVSSRCDVYSYGILLIETFTRKKPTDEMFTGETSLKNWVNESLPDELAEVVDANLLREEQAFSAKMDCLLSIMHLALDCCMESPEQRIDMTDAAAKLMKIKVTFLEDVAATN